MIELTQVLYTVLGGVLSAGVGFGVTMYQMRTEENGEREDWYYRTMSLARKVQEISNEENSDFDYDTSYNLLSEFSELLYQHDSNAPSGISRQVSDTLGETAYHCHRAGAVPVVQTADTDLFKKALKQTKDQAESLETVAERNL